MQTNNKQAKQATVTPVQAIAATGVAVNKQVANNIAVRLAQRIAQVQAKRAAKNAARKQAQNMQAYQLKIAQLAAEYGQPVPVPNAVVVSAHARANSATVAPSSTTVTVGGVTLKPCKAVHALCATSPADATRAQQLELCKDNGINSATASTQVGLYRAAQAKAAAELAKAH